ncbi:site-2 protease family protein [bacterium]|nr:site-2 protease family protein [bacterium]MBU1651994.1 site-2 protease family protein [bacterium]MBU1882179.1 site-2 protease family protein [bacterium]
MLVTIAAFIAVLGIIVFVHELGHFIAAKMVGIRVETFSLGFPPKMISKKVGDTEYCISWVPLGGYVKMAGMIDESMDNEPLTGASWEFMSKNFFQKVFVITAGVLMNFLLGFLVYFILSWQVGVPEASNEPIVGYAPEGYPAALAGMEIGDRVLLVDSDSIATWQALVDAIHPRAGDTLLVVWQRGEEAFSANLVPQSEEYVNGDSTISFGRIGINPKVNFTERGIGAAFQHGYYLTGFIITESLKIIRRLILGEESIKGIAGPIGIAQISGQSIRNGLVEYLSLIAQVSISIGLLNIMPFPVLDGGHLIFISIEAVIRRQIPAKVKLNVQKVGLALLLIFFLLVSYHDVMRIVVGP